MKFNQRKLLFLTLLLSLSPASQAAKIYKWVDENGKVHYSDKPPANQQKAESLTLESATEGTTNSSQKQPPAVSAQQRINEANKWLHNTRTKQQEKVQARDKAWNDKQKQIAECKKLKRELLDYENAGVIYDYNDKGEQFYFNQQQREKLLTNLRNKIAKQCKS